MMLLRQGVNDADGMTGKDDLRAVMAGPGKGGRGRGESRTARGVCLDLIW